MQTFQNLITSNSMNNALKILALLSSLLLFACQHDIEPDEQDFPEELEQSSIATAKMTPEERERILDELAAEPYPSYRVQGGDRFRVRVYNEEDLNHNTSATTLVTPDGYLIMDMIDPVMIKDLTIIEATEKLKEALSVYIKYPRVSMMPESIQGKTATLMGAVREPGEFSVTENTRLSDFIAKGKGYASGILDDNTVDLADINNAYISRDGRLLPINFAEALLKGNQRHNIRIFPQDVVYIPKKEESKVMVMGEVKRPRIVHWSEGMTFVDALAYCEGLSEDYWGTALILRKEAHTGGGELTVYKMNVDDILSGREKNFKLASGDIVYIPKDSLAEYNVFVRKLMPTAQFINLLATPISWWAGGR